MFPILPKEPHTYFNSVCKKSSLTQAISESQGKMSTSRKGKSKLVLPIHKAVLSTDGSDKILIKTPWLVSLSFSNLRCGNEGILLFQQQCAIGALTQDLFSAWS